MTEKKCADLVADRLAGRLEQFTFDADNADFAECKEKLDDYGRDYPMPDPTSADSAGCLEILENGYYDGGNDCVDRWLKSPGRSVERVMLAPTLEEVRAAIVEMIDDETISGLDDWRNAARDADYEGAHESVLCVDKWVRWQDKDGDDRAAMCDFTDCDEFIGWVASHDLWVGDVERFYRVCLSFGGPADYFDFFVDSDGDVRSARYLYQDWFDGAYADVPADQVEHLAQLFLTIE